jgi:hypothetical protein
MPFPKASRASVNRLNAQTAIVQGEASDTTRIFANSVALVNSAPITSPGNITLAAPAVAPIGTGQGFRITGSMYGLCNIVGATVTLRLFRDLTSVGPIAVSVAVSAAVTSNNIAGGSIQWIDVPGDSAPHVYSIHATVDTGTFQVPTGEASITVEQRG